MHNINERMSVTPTSRLGILLNDVANRPGWELDADGRVTSPTGEYRNLSMAMSGDDEDVKHTRVLALLDKIGYPIDHVDDTEDLLDDDPKRLNTLRVNPELYEEVDRSMKSNPGIAEIIDVDKARAILDAHEAACETMRNLTEEQWKILEGKTPPGKSTPPVKNRKLRQLHIRNLKTAIAQDGFQDDTLIAISPGVVIKGRRYGAGFLVDGQHRMHALAQLGREFPEFRHRIRCIVNRNASLFDFDHQDQGRGRGFIQTEEAHGRSGNSQSASTTRMTAILLMDGGSTVSWLNRKVSSHELRTTVRKLPDIEFDQLAARANAIRNARNKRISTAAIATTLMLAPIVWDKSPIEDFYRLFSTKDIDDIQGSEFPTLFINLREYFTEYIIKTGNIPAQVQETQNDKPAAVHFHMLITAYNMYCEKLEGKLEEKANLKRIYRLPRSGHRTYTIPGFYHPEKGPRETLRKQIRTLQQAGELPILRDGN